VLYEKGSPNVWIEAKEGIYSPGEENVHLKKEVVVKDADGTTLETKSLDWSSEESVLKTKEDIKLSRGNAVITGRDIEMYKNTNRAMIRENVKIKAFKEDPTQHPSIITCSGEMNANYNENFVEFNNDVVVIDSTVTLKAQYMNVKFSRKNKSLEKVFCSGKVIIIQQDKKAMSDTATYDTLDGVIVLKGNPKVIKEGNILTADTITFYVEDGRVVCEPSAQLVLFPSEEERTFFEL